MERFGSSAGHVLSHSKAEQDPLLDPAVYDPLFTDGLGRPNLPLFERGQ